MTPAAACQQVIKLLLAMDVENKIICTRVFFLPLQNIDNTPLVLGEIKPKPLQTPQPLLPAN